MIIDFQAFKNNKSDQDKLEDNYLKFLDYINAYLGVPSSFPKLLEATYFILRLLEGFVNIFSILVEYNLVSQNDVKDFKKYISDWLEDILKNLKDNT